MVVPADPPRPRTPETSPFAVQLGGELRHPVGRERDGLAAVAGRLHLLPVRPGRGEHLLPRYVRRERRRAEHPGVDDRDRHPRRPKPVADVSDFGALGVQRADEQDGHGERSLGPDRERRDAMLPVKRSRSTLRPRRAGHDDVARKADH